tara:strand:- start:297 stop:458 length:162 start_codon:yes stop_codon:yes gene_type:complete
VVEEDLLQDILMVVTVIMVDMILPLAVWDIAADLEAAMVAEELDTALLAVVVV